MKDFSKIQHKPVGYCIYCGSTEELSREHIIPFGLSGTAVIPKASCKACSKIINQFEQDVLRGPMWAVRILRRLKSRRKHSEAPKTYPLTVIRNGREEIINLPINQYPILLHFPIFAPPAFLYQSNYKSGIKISGVVTISFGPRPEIVLTQLGAQKIKISQKYNFISFARMLAKIAYCMAFAEGALKYIIGSSPVLPAILGKRDDIGRWVGTSNKPYTKDSNILHKVSIYRNNEKGLLIGEVRLFADSETPTYEVILGKLK